jgi:hypothetical protein
VPFSSALPLSLQPRLGSARRHDAAAPAAAARHGTAPTTARHRWAAAAVGWDPAADAAAVRRAAAGDVGTAAPSGELRAGAAPAAVLRRRAAGSSASSRTGVGRGEDALDRGPAVLDGRELHLQLLRHHWGGTRLDRTD